MYPNLRAEIARKGWTNSYVAERLEMNAASFSQKMNGKADFTMAEAKSLKALLGVDIPLDVLFDKVSE